MRHRALVFAMLASVACKSRDEANAGSGSGSAAPAPKLQHIVASPLPKVDASAKRIPLTEGVPPHEVLIDGSGPFAMFSLEKKSWSEVFLEVDTENPLTLAELTEVADRVSSDLKTAADKKFYKDREKAKEADHAERRANGETQEEIDESERTRIVEIWDMPDSGDHLYAQRPDTLILAKGDGVPVREEVPVRVPMLTAIVDDTHPSEPSLVAAPARARARVLVDALVATKGGLIAVAAPDGARALRLKLKHIDPDKANLEDKSWVSWLEVRLSRDAIDIEAVPGAPTRLEGALDVTKLVAAIASARAKRKGLAVDRTIDVLVDDTADVQRFVSLLAALDVSGVAEIGSERFRPGIRCVAIRSRSSRCPRSSSMSASLDTCRFMT